MTSGNGIIANIRRVSKEFSGHRAVKEVSFDVDAGDVLGLVGPNGAGKTTTIRMLLDIIRPDSGEISVFGRPLTEKSKDQIGYLPEERGLYRDRRVGDTLVYLASLKGVDKTTADNRVGRLLEAVGMEAVRNRKVKELSRGMGQLIQFVATVIHNPRLVILDEPFSGLDPVNVRLVKDIIAQYRSHGATFVLSTHQMNQVEALCDRVIMIDQGEVVLNGIIGEVKRRFGKNAIHVTCDHMPTDLPEVRSQKNENDHWELSLEEGVEPAVVLRALLDKGVSVDSYEVALPSLEEIFVRVVEGRR
jgi:ABC-2 type transport system ATP-binding protein